MKQPFPEFRPSWRRDRLRHIRIHLVSSRKQASHTGAKHMKRKTLIGISVTAVVLAGAGLAQFGGQPPAAYAQSAELQAALPGDLNGQPFPSLAPLVEATKPAVVSIAITRPTRDFRSPLQGDPFFDFFFRGRPRQQQEPEEQSPKPTGSGVIVDAESGLILTNHHVIQNTTAIEVTLSDGRTIEATVLGSDPRTDVALLKLATADNLTEMPMGNSEDVQVGDFVLAIGNPFGLNHTVTSGIVSALGRTIRGNSRRRLMSAPNPIEDFIQTDASINPGNSGGALVNMRGELVGIPSNIISRSGGNLGIGFAIPTSIARQIMRQLVEFGEVRRGRLGVIVGNVDQELAEALDLDSAAGAMVLQVLPDSAAEKAGIEPGDVVLSVDEKQIEGRNDLINAVGLRSVGEKITLEIIGESGNLKVVQAELGGVAEAAGVEIHPALVGASLADGEDRGIAGVLVESVTPGSAAEISGLQAKDLIFRINRTRVEDLEQLQAAAENRRLLLLHIRRGNQRVVLTLRS